MREGAPGAAARPACAVVTRVNGKGGACVGGYLCPGESHAYLDMVTHNSKPNFERIDTREVGGRIMTLCYASAFLAWTILRKQLIASRVSASFESKSS